MNNIAVIAHNRPEYLYVTLSSVFKMRDIDNWQVRIYIDDDNNEVKKIAEQFPVTSIKLQQKRMGNLKNLMYGLSDCFSHNANKTLYIEDDFLLRSDTLQYVNTVNDDYIFLSLSGNKVYESMDYRPIGNVILKSKFAHLQKWINSGKYINRPRPHHETQLLTKETTGHDGIFYRYLQDNALKTLFSDKYYIAHFGLRGMNYMYLTEEAKEIEKQMFNGDKSRWMSNIIDILENEKYPTELARRLWPRGYKYE